MKDAIPTLMDGGHGRPTESIEADHQAGAIRESNELAVLAIDDFDREHIDLIARTVQGGADNIQDIYPLSPLQEGMLFHRLVNERSDTYVLATLFELASTAQVPVLVNALQSVIDRHDVLRSAVLWENLPRPVQVVYRRATLLVEELALDPARDAREQMNEHIRPGRQSLEVRRAPLMQLRIGRIAERQQCYAALFVHHLVCDHQSLKIVVAEAMACAEGREASLPSPGRFRHYVEQSLSGTRAQDAETFFRSKLGSVQEPTAPFGLSDVHGDGSEIDEASQILEPALAQRVRTEARRNGVSVARLFHAAWALVVAHTSNRDEIVFGTVVLASRQRTARAQRVLGLSVNTLPLRLQLDGVSARELLEQAHLELTQLLNYEHVPLTLAQRCSGVDAAAPLFTSLLNFRHSAPDSRIEAGSAVGIYVRARGEAWTNYPITLIIDDVGDGFALMAQTDRRIDPRRIMDYLSTAVSSLTDALERAPQTPALSLTIVPRAEQRLLESFNANEAPYPRDELLHRLIEAQVARTPENVAVVYEGQSLSYAELNGRANQLARYLRAHAVSADQLVGICIERSVEMVVGLLGILKAGAAYVPLDPSYPAERLSYMLQDAAPRVLLTSGALKPRLSEGSAHVIALDAQWDEIAQHSAENLNDEGSVGRADQLAYVIYTSGSTGRPKGAMNEHRAIVNRLHWMQQQYQLGGSDRVLQKTPFSFDVSVWEFFWTLLSGARLVVARPYGHQDPQYLINLIEEAGVTTLHFVPSMLQIFLNELRAGQCACLKHIVCSGEELPATLQQKAFECLPKVKLSNLYGPTEAAVDVTFWECQRDESAVRVPIGRPIANTRMYVLDRYMQPVPLGVAGEIHIGGVGVGRGYWNRPELTAERFVRDPFSSDLRARLYKTGDLGRWRADGALEYLGRNDHQVKVRGLRIELGEIEAQIARHAGVKETVVLAREDVPGDKRLVAYVVPTSTALSVEELREYLKPVLPDYMVPNAFVLLECMPLTPNGKLDRRALPAPELDAHVSRAYEPPSGDVEEILAGIWQALLGIERIGRHDNFFELGGHSLLIVQMMERLRRVGLSATLRRVFDSPTLADLASTLANEAIEQFAVPDNLIPPGCEAITPEMLPLIELTAQHIERIVQRVPGGAANIQDIYPLAPLQEGILFHHLFDEGRGDTYVLATVLAVTSRERVDELIAALQCVIDRHDVLRTAVMWEELPQPVQVVQRRAAMPIEELALDDDRDGLEQIREWIKPERQRFDLRHAPLVRLQIASDARSEQWYVVFRTHHIALDHVTAEAVIAEIAAHIEGHGHQLPMSVPYRNHVAQSIAHARKHDAEKFFHSKLADIDEPTAPFGLIDVHGDGTQIEEARGELELADAQRIRAQARRLSVSAATLFHAAWALVVAGTSGRDDVVFGSVLLGRLQGNAGAQQILGMFINTLPLRLQLGGVTAKDLVERTQRELVELLAYEQASLAVAQRCSGVVGSAPLFTTLLNYRHSVASPEAQWSKVKGISVQIGQERTNYPITLSIDDFGDGFALSALTDRGVDPNRIIGYLRTAVLSLVEALERSPQRAALELSILPEGERRQVLELFNATRTPYPRQKLVHQLFEEQVRRGPDSVAIVHEQSSLTYAELNRRANRLARHLRSLGVGPDQLVGICLERGIDMIVGLLGILKAGGAYLPLDPNYPAERLRYMLEDGAPKVVLTQTCLQQLLPATSAHVVMLDAESLAAPPDDDLGVSEGGLSSKNLLYVIYTSGSTGRPKGTEMSHAAMINLIEWHRVCLSAEHKRVLQFAALSFDVAFQDTFSTLCTGGTLVMLNEWVRRDMRALAELLSTQRIGRMFVPPLVLQSLAEYLRTTDLPLPALQEVITAGEQLRITPEIRELGKRIPGFRLHNHYGPTETHVVTALTLPDDPDEWEALPTIGTPIANTRIVILDGHQQPVPLDVSGEIYIAGAGVARGYRNRPELTADRFVRDTFFGTTDGRMYRTGDLGRWRADGAIEYLGRNDDQVKIRGFRVELGELEAQLARHADVREVAVLAREDAAGGKRLVAYVTAREQRVPGADELREYLRAFVPEHMVPAAFVILDSLPLTPSGKLNRRALPKPDLDAYATAHHEAPDGYIEKRLAEIWEELLGVERVGRQDDFFELGGHSLLALRALLRINEVLGCTLRVADLYMTPTIRDLAEQIAGRAAEDVRVDLSREAVLDTSIVASPGSLPQPAREIMLTGATGFVGRFLLAQLLSDTKATIYCMIRARSEHHALARLKTALSQWGLWQDKFERRIVAVAGDLRLPRLGLDEPTYRLLAQRVDSIYHCATSMNHLETYAMAKPANVGAITELLKLATSHKPKLINYTSTLGVFASSADDVPRVVHEESPIESESHMSSQGYMASKWVAEKILMMARERGIPCNIFRLGLAWGDAEQGRFDELQHVYRMLKSCLLSGYGIENYHYPMPPTPIDYVARAIVSLGRHYVPERAIHHISSSKQMSDGVFERCNEVMGTSLQLLPYYDWICQIKRLHREGLSLPVVPLVEFAFNMDRESFERYQRSVRWVANIHFDFTRTHRDLERAGIVAPVLNDELLTLCLRSMLDRDVALQGKNLSGMSEMFALETSAISHLPSHQRRTQHRKVQSEEPRT